MYFNIVNIQTGQVRVVLTHGGFLINIKPKKMFLGYGPLYLLNLLDLKTE